jgi:hypothetical protein
MVSVLAVPADTRTPPDGRRGRQDLIGRQRSGQQVAPSLLARLWKKCPKAVEVPLGLEDEQQIAKQNPRVGGMAVKPSDHHLGWDTVIGLGARVREARTQNRHFRVELFLLWGTLCAMRFRLFSSNMCFTAHRVSLAALT